MVGFRFRQSYRPEFRGPKGFLNMISHDFRKVHGWPLYLSVALWTAAFTHLHFKYDDEAKKSSTFVSKFQKIQQKRFDNDFHAYEHRMKLRHEGRLPPPNEDPWGGHH